MQELTHSPDFRLMIIDDDRNHNLLMERIVKSIDAEIDVYSLTGGEAACVFFDKFDHKKEILPNIILLDFHMPVHDGRAVLRKIRDTPGCSGVPVIVMTGDLNEELHRSLYREGANSIVIKKRSHVDMKRLIQDLIFYWFRTSSVFYV